MWARLWLVVSLIVGIAPATSHADTDLGAGEVRVYLQPEFSGPHKSWALSGDERHLAVADLGSPWAGNVVSIELGPEAAVMLFEQVNFRFRGSAYVKFAASVGDLSVSVSGAANRYSSLVVFRRALGNPLGLLAGNSGGSEFRFFPLFRHAGCSYADVRHLMPPPIDFVLLYSAQGAGEKVSATLFDGLGCQGKSLGLKAKAPLDSYRLADLGFPGPVVSMNLETSLPVAKLKDSASATLGDLARAGSPTTAPGTSAVKTACSIAGRATGANASRAPWYRLTLYGPDDLGRRHGSSRFDAAAGFRFNDLADGRYRIEVTADPGKADLPYPLLPPSPAATTVRCAGAALTGVTFRFD